MVGFEEGELLNCERPASAAGVCSCITPAAAHRWEKVLEISVIKRSSRSDSAAVGSSSLFICIQQLSCKMGFELFKQFFGD